MIKSVLRALVTMTNLKMLYCEMVKSDRFNF